MSTPQLDPQRSSGASTNWLDDHAAAWQQLRLTCAGWLSMSQRQIAELIRNTRSKTAEQPLVAITAGLLFNVVLSLAWTGAAAAGDLRLNAPRTTVWLLAGLAVVNSAILMALKRIPNSSFCAGSNSKQPAMPSDWRALITSNIYGVPAATIICVLPFVICGIALWPDSNWIFAESAVLVVVVLNVANSKTTAAVSTTANATASPIRTDGTIVAAVVPGDLPQHSVASVNSVATEPAASTNECEGAPMFEKLESHLQHLYSEDRPLRQQSWQWSEDELRVEGDDTVRFADGQRVSTVHLVFHPPLPQTPEFFVELDADADSIRGTDVRLNVAGVYPHGVRVEARRSGSDVSAAVQRFTYVAVCRDSSSELPPETAVA